MNVFIKYSRLTERTDCFKAKCKQRFLQFSYKWHKESIKILRQLVCKQAEIFRVKTFLIPPEFCFILFFLLHSIMLLILFSSSSRSFALSTNSPLSPLTPPAFSSSFSPPSPSLRFFSLLDQESSFSLLSFFNCPASIAPFYRPSQSSLAYLFRPRCLPERAGPVVMATAASPAECRKLWIRAFRLITF